MRLHPRTSRTMTAVGGAGLLGLAFLAAPTLAAFAFEEGPPREHPAPPAPPAPPEAAAPPEQDGVDEEADEKAAVDAMTKRVQELAERLSQQAEPVADEVRKAIGDAASALGDTLKRDDVSTDDIKSALERARDELTRAFQEGGPVDRTARDAIRKAQEEVRDNLERSRKDARQALRRRYEAERERLGAMADEVKEKVDATADEVKEKVDEAASSPHEVERRIAEEFRKDPEIASFYDRKQELERKLDQVKRGARRKDEPVRKALEDQLNEVSTAIDRGWKERYHDIRRSILTEDRGSEEAAKPAEEKDDLANANRRVHELQEQLREAQRELQRFERPGREGRPISPRGRFGAMRPGPGPGPGRPGPEARPSPEADRRLDALEAKMDRVLQALEGLKAPKPDGDDDDDEDDDD